MSAHVETDERWNEEYERRMRGALAAGRTTFVLVPWDDAEETPLDAIGRLNAEAMTYEGETAQEEPMTVDEYPEGFDTDPTSPGYTQGREI